MTRDDNASTMLSAVWPPDMPAAIDRMAHRPMPVRMKQDKPRANANVGTAGASERQLAFLECLVRDDFDRFHPDDTFDDLKRRARFSKEDRGVLGDWLALARRRESALTRATAIAAE